MGPNQIRDERIILQCKKWKEKVSTIPKSIATSRNPVWDVMTLYASSSSFADKILQERLQGVALEITKEKIIQLWFPLWSIIEWWRNNFPEIKGPAMKQSVWVGKVLKTNICIPFFLLCPLPSAQIKMDKAEESDIVVLSQSAKHYSFPWIFYHKTRRRKKVKMFVIFIIFCATSFLRVTIELEIV